MRIGGGEERERERGGEGEEMCGEESTFHIVTDQRRVEAL